jgi:filamentous hemagglutinin family protein
MPDQFANWPQKLIAFAVSSCFAGSAYANPTGPSVVAGGATFASSGNALTVTNTPGSVINWAQFSIAKDETTRFIQQNAQSAVLNRVMGQDPSQLLGTLTSNGRVFLINPNGITFGMGSVVDVGGLVASTLNLSNQDFIAGRNNFVATPGAGKLLNQGSLSARNGGSIYLVASSVENGGVITTPGGEVILAAGKSANLVDSANPDIRVEITAPDNQALNVGAIVGRNVGIYGGLIRHSGTVNANAAVVGDGGKIMFKAVGDVTLDGSSVTGVNGANGGTITAQSDTGTTLVSGTLSATGTAGQGGTVKLLGVQVGVADHATVDASGATGGGTVLVGGDAHGANAAVQNATATYFGADALLKADATDAGNGGKVVVWSDDTTRAYGRISARAGANAGDGGFVETSGRYLDVAGSNVNTSAPQGFTGTWLLDPTNIYVAQDQATATAAGMTGTNSSANTGPSIFAASGAVQDSLLTTGALTGALAGTNVQVTTTNAAGTGLGDINVVSAVNYTSANSLLLNANRNINIIGNNVTNAGSGAINLTATNNITVQNAIVSTVGTMNVGAANLAVNATSTTTSELFSGGLQTINAGGITVQNSASGTLNRARIRSSGGQTITANQITLIGESDSTSQSNNAEIFNSGGAQSITVNGGGTVSITGGVGTTNLVRIQNQGLGPQSITFTAGGALNLQGASGAGGSNIVRVTNISGSAQTISFTGAGAINLTGGTVGAMNDAAISNYVGSQSISGNPTIQLKGGASGSDNSAFIQSVGGTQSITAGAGGITLIGGGVASTHNIAVISQFDAAGSQAITVNGGGTIQLTGGAGSGGGNSALITSAGLTQSVTFAAGGSINIAGGTVGIGNSAYIDSTAGSQTISGATGITLTGGASGGAEGTSQINSSGNYAMLWGNASQEITVGAGGITATGGSGTGADNFAVVRQGQISLTPATPGTHQTITVNNGGTITLQGGSTPFISTPNGHGSNGVIRGEGDAQTINFTSGGAISITGGTQGTNKAGIFTSTAAQQTITGSPTVNMTGGASGGASGDGNYAEIYAGVGQQTLTLGATTMIGAGGGVDNHAAILAQNQNITVNGNLSITGSSGATATGAAGSRIGAPSDQATSLTLAVHGGITLNGGATSNNGSAIGSSNYSATPQTDDLTISADGDITLNGGTVSGTRIGQPLGLVGGGTINVTAGGNIALNGNATTGGAIRTLGNLIVNATNDISVQDSTITAGGTENISAGNNLSVTANAKSSLIQATGSGLQTISANGITVQGAAAGTNFGAEIDSNGGQTITAGANGITLTGGAGGSGNNANINQNGLSNDQLITVNGGGNITLTGGGGTQNSAVIENQGLAQSISFTAAGSALNLQGGSGAGGGNLAGVGNSGAGATTQTISFANGGAINVTGGTNGIDNGAGIQAATGNQTITGNADITLTGGATGGGVNAGNDASINLKLGAGGIQTISAHNLLLQGGAGGIENGATIGTETSGQASSITATGSVALTGGAGTDALAAIGSDKSDVNITLNATGPVTLTGGSGAFANYGAFAGIGVLGGFNANVTLNSNSNVALTGGSGVGAGAYIGSIGSSTGGGTINVSAGVGGTGSISLAGGSIIGATGNITLQASGDLTQTGGTISNALGGTSTVGTNDIRLSGNNVTLTSVASQRDLFVTAAGALSVAGVAAAGAQNFHVDDDFFSYTLPFTFNFYGTPYNTVYISANGVVSFGSGVYEYVDSVGGLAAYRVAAPAWNDWVTYGTNTNGSPHDVFIGNSAAGLTVRWDVGRYANESSMAQFETVLGRSGNITFNYGPANTSFAGDVTIGLSNQSSGSTVVSQLMNQPNFSLNGLNSTTFTYDAVSGSYAEVVSAGSNWSGTALGGGGGGAGLLSALRNAQFQAGTSIVLNGSIAAMGNLMLIAGGQISQTAGTINTTGTLTGSAGTTAVLDQSNTIANLGAFTSNGLTVNDGADGLNVTGVVNAGTGPASITTAGGNLAVNNSVTGTGVTLVANGANNNVALAAAVNGNAGNVALNAGGQISQTAAGTINTTGTLTGSAGTTAVLDQNNTIANLGAFTTNGAFTLNDTAGGLNVTGVVNSGTGALTLNVPAGNLDVTATTAPAKLGGATVNVTVSNDVTLTAGTVNDASAEIFGTGNVTMTVGRNVTLTGAQGAVTGAHALIQGSPDVTLTLNGALSTITMTGNNSDATDYARIQAVSPVTVHVDFAHRKDAGGIVVSGLGSGFYANGVPAVAGAGLDLISPEATAPLSQDNSNPVTTVVLNTVDNAINTATSAAASETGAGSATKTEEKKKEQAQQESTAQGDKARPAALPTCK